MTEKTGFTLQMVPVDTCQIAGLQHMLYAAFGDLRDGYFVEIGAFDGVTYSNTFHLARAGWSGVYVEPIPALYKRCVGNHKDHPGVQVLQELVGDDTTPLPIYFDGVELYTTRKWLAKELSDGRKIAQIASIRPVSLNYILESSSVPKHFDLLVIDVEGAEIDVLLSFNIARWFPKMIIIEAHECHENPKLSRHAEMINDHMETYLYTKIYSDSFNNVYVR